MRPLATLAATGLLAAALAPSAHAFAQKYLPVLQQHLEGARAHLNMKDDMNK